MTNFVNTSIDSYSCCNSHTDNENSTTKSYWEKQILILGGGFDSIGLLSASSNPKVKVFELDYPEIITKKAKMINEIEQAKIFYDSGQYNLIGIDLCDESSSIYATLTEKGFNWKTPTLVYTECVLVYFDKLNAEKLIQILVSNISLIVWLTYDMVVIYY